ncbi:MAG: ethylbenzene dehydrogenase-related protein, partial [Vicinamibacterales bacterium]
VTGVWVRALYNESELALSLRWHDRFQDTGAEGKPADALAVQFPAQLPAGDERPYFVFGDAAHPVNLWVWSAATNPSAEFTLSEAEVLRASAVEERNGTGADAVTAQSTQNAQGTASFADGEYALVVRRALDTGDAEDIQFEPGKFIPIAFMAWDGWRGEQDAAGAISSWNLIALEQPAPIVNFAWVPVAVIVTAVLEWWIVRAVRRANTTAN